MTNLKVLIDPGHEGVLPKLDPGAGAGGLHEANIVLDIANRVYKGLSLYNVDLKMTRTKAQSNSLKYKMDLSNSWKADFYFSIHINSASAKSARGYEDFIHDKLSNSTNTAKIRDIIHQEISSVMVDYKIPNRGKKKANYHVLRETNCSAILVEVLFVSNEHDRKLLQDTKFLQAVADAYIRGIARALGLSKKVVKKPAPIKPTPIKSSPTKPNSKVFYRVVTGSFENRANANDRVTSLKTKGFSSFLSADIVNGKQTFRVITGSYEKYDNAELQVKLLKTKGFSSFINLYKE